MRRESGTAKFRRVIEYYYPPCFGMGTCANAVVADMHECCSVKGVSTLAGNGNISRLINFLFGRTKNLGSSRNPGAFITTKTDRFSYHNG